MSTSINDGGPAFPESGERGKAAGGEGMSLRDWFAGQALTGLLANCTAISTQDAAQWAMQFADAMLAARNQNTEKPRNAT